MKLSPQSAPALSIIHWYCRIVGPEALNPMSPLPLTDIDLRQYYPEDLFRHLKNQTPFEKLAEQILRTTEDGKKTCQVVWDDLHRRLEYLEHVRTSSNDYRGAIGRWRVHPEVIKGRGGAEQVTKAQARVLQQNRLALALAIDDYNALIAAERRLAGLVLYFDHSPRLQLVLYKSGLIREWAVYPIRLPLILLGVALASSAGLFYLAR